LFVDASYFKVRDERAGRYRLKALLIVAQTVKGKDSGLIYLRS